MVNKSPHIPRPHVMDAVKVRNVNSTRVRCWILLVMLVDVKAEQYDINSIQILKDDNALASKRELVRVVPEGVSSLHAFPYFQFPIHGGNLANSDGAAH